MQPELLIAIAVAFGVGFLFGYFVRAMISRRRRRRSSRRLEHRTAKSEHDLGFRLERLARAEGSEGASSLTPAADAPSLADLDVAPRPPVTKSEPLGPAVQRKANGTMGEH